MSVTVYKDIQFLKILNTPEELAAFPVEGEAALLFSNSIDEENIKDYIFLIREKPNQDVVNIAFNEVKHIGDINVDYYDLVDYNWSTEIADASLGSKPIYIIKPKEPLLPNNKYTLVLSKNLLPVFYGTEKTVSVGPSFIDLIVKNPVVTGISTTIPTVYEIEITANSIIGNGTHSITYTLRKDGTIISTGNTLEIRSQKLTLFSGVQVHFSENVPFLNGEKFEITIVPPNKLGSTFVQTLVTYIDSEVFPIPEEEANTKITQEALINFYEANGFSRRLGTPENIYTTPATGTDIKAKTSFELKYPSVLLIKLDQAYNPSTLDQTFFKISLGPAFDNYFLDNMGLYNKDNKYVITYAPLEDEFGETTIIRLTISLDIANLVPSGEQFIIQAE